MTRVLALVDHSKIGCITQRRFAKAGTKTHPQRGAALDRNGLSVSTETACRFEPKSPVGNSEICMLVKEILVSDDRIVIRHSIPLPTGPSGSHDPSPIGGYSSSASGKSYLLRSGSDQPAACKPVPALCVRRMDVAKLSAH